MTVAAEGVVEAVRQTTLGAQVAGRIVALDVKAGDTVRAGQVLARIDARTAEQAVAASRSQVAEAQANLANAKRKYERSRDLLAQKFVSQAALDQAGITVNKNTIPFETRSPFQASGIRLGTPAVTTRGMKETEMAAVADMLSEALMDIKHLDTLTKVRQRVSELTARFPLPY